MANIFKEQEGFNNHPNRYNHDISHKVYGSYKAGRIYPVFCQQLNPTESIRLDIASLLQFMPSIRPLQSNMRVVFHAFVNRNKNMQKNWQNCIEGLPDDDGNEVVIPYVLPSESQFTHDSLLNYLGVPTCKVVNDVFDFPLTFISSRSPREIPILNPSLLSRLSERGSFINYVPSSINSSLREGDAIGSNAISFVTDNISLSLVQRDGNGYWSNLVIPFVPWFGDYNLRAFIVGHFKEDPIFPDLKDRIIFDLGDPMFSNNFFTFLMPSVEDLLAPYSSGEQYNQLEKISFLFYMVPRSIAENPADVSSYNSVAVDLTSKSSPLKIAVNGSFDLADFPQFNPFATLEHPDRPIKLNAFPFRLYEGIYNGFYRNNHDVQQFMINGRPVYNRYNTNTGDGADETRYDFFNRNWELDAYTSALPSPQQGNPPIVGVSPFGVLTIRDDDGTTSTVQLQDLPDGQQGLSYSNVNLANGEHQQLFMSIANSGLTINDLRQANALQRFLETNMRKGFRYVDFLLGHFGKAPRHAEIDMPEFIGGCTVKMNADQVFNSNGVATSEDDNPLLGDVAGKNSAFGGSKHNISYYADDYCYLMVTMCIVPDNAYAQVLPKHFLYHQPLDYAFPEFTQLGYQPIDYREFCPIEAYADSLTDSNKSVFDVFGYQRPNYDKIWHPDTLHGLFCTSLNRLAINRNFLHRPELSNEFLQIDSKDTIQPFADTLGDDDIAYGQIAIHATLKTFIPRIVVPTIGK